MDPSEVASFLHHLIQPEKVPSPFERQIHRDLVSHRRDLDSLGYEYLAEVYSESSRQEWIDVMVLLRSDHEREDQMEFMPEGFRARLGALTLGERRQLSRRQKRRNLEFLLFDSDPRVIKELLNNPRLLERDVIRIAARHQAPPAVLEEVSKSEKWIQRPGVRKALIFNPKTPVAYALTLAYHLTTTELRFLLRVGSSRKELLDVARKRLNERKALGI